MEDIPIDERHIAAYLRRKKSFDVWGNRASIEDFPVEWLHISQKEIGKIVQADEDEYKKKQEFERARLAKAKKVQENVDKTREQNARRKMEKVCPRRMSAGTCPPTYQNVGPESRMGLGKILARMDQA